jgi:hypothetical protein
LNEAKQLTLKPQDLVVAVKVAVNRNRSFLLADLSRELFIALSLIHGSVRRAEQARLLSRASGSIRSIPANLKEFVIHGAKYCFPGQLGSLTRGIPTAVGGPGLIEEFGTADVLAPVWPDPEGTAWGPSLQPLHSSLPAAAKADPALYLALSLLDALRVGAAREREIASSRLAELI